MEGMCTVCSEESECQLFKSIHFSKIEAWKFQEFISYSHSFIHYWAFVIDHNTNSISRANAHMVYMEKNQHFALTLYCYVGLLSMLRSDWLSYYYALRYTPLLAKSAGFENQTMAAESPFFSSFNQRKKFDIFLTNQLDFTKIIIHLAHMASGSIAHAAFSFTGY